MGTISHIGDLIDKHAMYVETVSVDERNNSVLVKTVEKRGDRQFSMMKGIFEIITRETGLVPAAIDGTAGDEHETRIWFTEPEIGIREL